ncbi:MAG: hypothetical protein O2910_08480 [Proteobacteria bacterium]|nr:hypothetical protein [Pseudomonadota bacterium]
MKEVEDQVAIKRVLVDTIGANWVTGQRFLNGSDRRYWTPTFAELDGILAHC